MAIISNCACVDLLAVLITLTVGLITYFKWAFKYWERKKMPYITPTFPFGTLKNPIWKPEAFGQQIEKLYSQAKAKGYKHVGLFGFALPIYMPIDPEYVKDILTKNFNHFVDRGMYFNEKTDPLSAHLFSIEGAKWKNLRTKLTPTFTSGKMKMMFQTLVECGNQLKDFMDQSGNEPVDIKDVLGRFTTDVIGSCAFGLQCNSFKDPNSAFRKHLKRAFTATRYEIVKGALVFATPNLSKSLGVIITPKEVTKFVMGVVKDTVEYREKTKVERKDFLQILLDLKKNVADDSEINQYDGKTLTMEELAAQAFIFLFAGFETSSTTMTFCLFELALNPHIQRRVREEINDVLEKYDGKITYDALVEMKYMGQVIDETLRKYPPVPTLTRRCLMDYNVPGTDIVIEKGTAVFIPVIGLQRDDEYYPEPDKFDPERFSEQNKTKINPFTYIPFGEGPRICIGLRFGIMQTKVGLTVLLKNYIFSLNNKTELPLKLSPASFILSTVGKIWLDVQKVQTTEC